MTDGERELRVARDELNQTEKETVLIEASKKREYLVSLCHKAITRFARGDHIEKQSFLEDQSGQTTLSTHVKEGFLAAPMKEDGSFTHTLSIQLVPPGQVDNDEFLRVYLPIPNELLLDYEHNVLDLPVPDTIFVEKKEHSGEISRHAVSLTGVVEYESAYDTGEQVIKDEFHPERMWRVLNLRVDSGLPFLNQLHEDLVNMNVIPQFEETTEQ